MFIASMAWDAFEHVMLSSGLLYNIILLCHALTCYSWSGVHTFASGSSEVLAASLEYQLDGETFRHPQVGDDRC